MSLMSRSVLPLPTLPTTASSPIDANSSTAGNQAFQNVNVNTATTFTALTKDIATAPQVFILGWCADYPDPQNWLSVYWKTGAFGERIGYSNPELDALLVQAETALDPVKRAELYAQAQTLLTDGAPVAFMWNNVNRYLVKPWVTDAVLTPLDSGFAGSISPWTIDIDTAAQAAGQ